MRCCLPGPLGLRLACAAVLALGCSGPQSSVVEPAELVTHRRTDQPPLVIVEREGDPQGAVAIAVFVPVGIDATASIGATVVKALGAVGVAAQARASSDAVLVAARVPKVSLAPRILAAVRRGLFEAPLVAASPGPVPPAPCGAAVRAVPAAVARGSVGASNAALGVVGPAPLAAAFADAYAVADPWPIGSGLEDPWPDADAAGAVPSKAGDALTVALRVADGPRALAAARALGAPRSTLRMAAAASAPGWQVGRVTATLRPSGACLAAELVVSETRRRPSGVARAGTVRAAGRAAAAAKLELIRAFETAIPIATEWLALEAADPRQAAMRAAWAALAAPAHDAPVRGRVAYAGAAPGQKVFEREIAMARPLKIDLRAQVEAGQGRIWALLSSACPTAHEELASAGHTAAALTAAARFAQGDSARVDVQPWVDARGLGLLANAPAHDGQAAGDVAEAIGRALLAVAVDAPLIGDTREWMLAGREPSPHWDLALRIVSGGHPSHLLPWGTHAGLAGMAPASAQYALRALVRGRLRLAVLSNASEDQAEQLRDRLAALLVPLGPSLGECPKPVRPRVEAGEYVVQSGAAPEHDAGEALLLFPIRTARLPLAETAAALLELPGGWLERSILTPRIASRVRALAIGLPGQQAAFVIALTAPPQRLGEAVMQTRALVEQLGRTHFGQADLAALRAANAAHPPGLDPKVRLARLLADPAPAVTSAAVRDFFKKDLHPQRLVVVRPETDPGPE